MRRSIAEHKLVQIDSVNDALNDMKRLHTSEVSMSTLLGLDVPTEVAVQQHVNVLLVGVARAREHYTARAVEPWFRHVAHALPHVLAPVGAAQTTTDRVQTPQTSLVFNVSLSFIELSPRVATVLEEVMMRHIRAEAKTCATPDDAGSDKCNVHRTVLGDPDLGTERYYVDAARFSAVLADLLQFLGLDSSFSLFVLNLASPVDREHATYGYRVGFSEFELKEIRSNTSALSLSQAEHTPRRWTDGYKTRQRPAAASSAPPSRFVTKVAESEAWANRLTEIQFKARALRDYQIGVTADRATAEQTYGVDELRRLAKVCEEVDPDDLTCILRAEPAAHGSTLDMVSEIAAIGTDEERRYVQQLLRDNTGLIRSDCLVDAWVSHDRLAFLDLGAGPLDWGPTVAAAGVKTFESFPRMPDEGLIEHELANLTAKRSAPPTRFASQTEAFAESSLLAVYRDLHCFYGMDRVCSQLAHRVQELQSSPLAQRPWLAVASRDGVDDASDATSATEDEFLSELAHVVLGLGVRHVFLPPASLYPPVLDRSVSFHLFVVVDHTAYPAIDDLTFDWKRVRGELQALRLPFQDFSFRESTVALHEEPHVVAALAASLRTSTLPTLDSEGMFRAMPTRYIDATVLRERLVTLHVDGDSHGIGADATRHINLFLFSLGDETPLLIDKYYQAKALDDMVVIVQSNSRNFSSRFACNGALVDIDMRNPTHATLGSLGQLLGGHVPAHIQYELTRTAASQDWRWAVGARPNIAMAMSPLARFGQLSRDITLRNAAMSAVTDSLDRLRVIRGDLNERQMSSALAVLEFVRPGMLDLAGQLAGWSSAVNYVVHCLSDMRFEDAVVAARVLRDVVFEVEEAVEKLTGAHDTLTCYTNSVAMRKEASEKAMADPTSPQLPAPRATPAVALPLVPWRSSVISVLVVVQLALVLGYATWKFWTAGARAQNKVKVN